MINVFRIKPYKLYHILRYSEQCVVASLFLLLLLLLPLLPIIRPVLGYSSNIPRFVVCGSLPFSALYIAWTTHPRSYDLVIINP